MVTVEQIVDYLERVIAEDRLSGNVHGQRHAEDAQALLAQARSGGGGVPEVLEQLQRQIEAAGKAGDQAGLRNLQYAAGVLMRAAEFAGDKQTARQLRAEAANAANQIEDLSDV